MESLDLDTFECIIESLCTECGPYRPLYECSCVDAHGTASCPVREAEAEGFTSTLAALCLTSTYVNSIATRHLYHRPTCKKWWLLARTLFKRPDLAKQVRHLRTRGWGKQPNRYNQIEIPASVFQHHKKRLGMAYDAKDRVPGGPLPIFTSLCPSIEVIDADSKRDVDNKSAGRIHDCEPGSLKNLRSLVLWYCHTPRGYDGLDLSSLQPILAEAPNIERIAAWQPHEWSRNPMFPHLSVFRSVTHLHLYDCDMSADAINDIIAAFPRLVSFEYLATSSKFWFDDSVTPLNVQEALLEHASDLRNLRLNFNKCDFAIDRHVDDGCLITSLASLTKLTSLTVDTRCLIPHVDPLSVEDPILEPREDEVRKLGNDALVDLLPGSIRELRVQRGSEGPDVGELVPSLSCLAKARDQFPVLRKVEVCGEGTENVEETCGDAFVAAGIEFHRRETSWGVGYYGF